MTSSPTVRRTVTAIACLAIVVAALAALTPGRADAHPLSTTAILLDAGTDAVTGRVQLPIDRLAIALDQPTLTTAAAQQPTKLDELRRYVQAHTSAAGQVGTAWTTTVSGGRVQSIDGVDHLVFDLTLRPPDGTVTDFRLTYDAIVQRLLSHRIFVSARTGGTGDYTTVGVIDWEQHTLTVPAAGAARQDGFLAAVHLGIRHIAEGPDHLLFLITLLLPAPLLARHRRWVRGGNLRRHCVRIAHVVTAFAVGHSITLALAAFGLISVPTRVVESLIAVSIAVSGIHAIRPLVRDGEAWIAAGFGLMHGLAFAALLRDLQLGRGSLVADLLGFNLGIELTQLIVVTLVMPSLLVLARTRVYPAFRVAAASAGILLATAWLAERTTLLTTNPLNVVTDSLVAHPFAVAASLAAIAAAAIGIPQLRITTEAPRRKMEVSRSALREVRDGTRRSPSL